MINIILIGAGKLGSRHLQSLSQVAIPETSILVIDPNQEAIAKAKLLLQDIPINKNVLSIKYFENLGELSIDEFDLAIVATTSDYRKNIVIDLCNKFKIHNLVLEKFLFQDEATYSQINELLRIKKVNTWVNCPRRMWEFYKGLKSRLEQNQILDFDVFGANWSMATSAIHFLDLIAFLTGVKSYEIEHLDFGNKIVPAYSVITGPRESKYIEFYGSIKGKFKNSTSFNFTCLESEIPYTISIKTNKEVILILEDNGKCFISTIDFNGKLNNLELPVIVEYQSQITRNIAEQIILSGESALTRYEDSMELHLPLLKGYLDYLSDIKNEIISVCPIT
jgi:Trk K+ transport system NAD-binding subunit